MSRGSRAAPHLSLEAIEQKLKSTDSYWPRQKWLIVYNRPLAKVVAGVLWGLNKGDRYPLFISFAYLID